MEKDLRNLPNGFIAMPEEPHLRSQVRPFEKTQDVSELLRKEFFDKNPNRET